jgi:putative RecB family exonuclease
MKTPAEAPKVIELSEKDIITGLQNTVSASRLSLYLQCRLKFFFRYVLKLKKPKTASLHVGNSVHSALKAWNKARWLNKPLTLKGLHDEFTKAWADISEGNVPWEAGEEDEEKTTGWRLCDTYIRQSGEMANIKPDAVEVSIEADLSQHGLPRLIGILDLVQEGSIIDFKTSSSTPNSSSVEHLHETQTSSYAVLYRHNTGKKETGIELHHLVKNKSPKLCITDMPPMTDQQQSRLFHLMDVYQNELGKGQFYPSPSFGCMGCEFFAECRRWH